MTEDATRSMLPRLLVRALVGFLALLPVAPAAADSAVILPVSGDPSLVAHLNPALGRAVAVKGMPAVLGPLEANARLSGDPTVAAALARAREAIERAREFELRMDRPAAVEAAREAIRTLEQQHAAMVAPGLLVEAHICLALALLLQPEDWQAAQDAMRRVLALDPGYRPAPGQLSARATLLLDQARESGPRLTQPDPRALEWAARRFQLAKLIWLGVERRGEGRVRIEAVLFDPVARRVRVRLTQETPLSQVLPVAAGLVVQALGNDPLADTTETQKAMSRPWYRRWWVWAIAGAVVVGAAVGIGFAVASPSEDPRTNANSIRFHF